MANEQVVVTGVKGLSTFLNQDKVKEKFAEIIGSDSSGFIASLLSVVNDNKLLANADQNSIYTAALMAASLKLPINQNLGLAYIVPYAGKAQFQLGYKGFKQLAQRSGQFKTMHDTDIREGEILSHNRLSGEIEFSWDQNSKNRLNKRVIGYVSYFKLLNGFESTFYMTVEELTAHAKKYSQVFRKYGTGLWKDDFDGMARKTVTKLNLSKNAPLSVEMQRATIADQAVIKDFDPSKNDDAVIIDAEYVDNEQDSRDPKEISEEKESLRIIEHIEKSKDLKKLAQVKDLLTNDDLKLLYTNKVKELTKQA